MKLTIMIETDSVLNLKRLLNSTIKYLMLNQAKILRKDNEELEKKDKTGTVAVYFTRAKTIPSGWKEGSGQKHDNTEAIPPE